jgi:hypothetical protein
MERYNIFYQIHKGLRVMLYNSATLIQRTDFTNEEEAAEAIDRINEVILLFDKHAHSEDHHILNAIEAHDPSVAELFIDEHVLDHELGNKLITLTRIYGSLDQDETREELGSAIRLAFTEFLVFNLQHMAKEEKELNQKLWNYFSDDELHAMTGTIINGIPSDMLQQYNIWMMRGLSNLEIIGWLRQVRSSAPDFVFSGMLELAEAELDQQRFSAIVGALTEGAMVE